MKSSVRLRNEYDSNRVLTTASPDSVSSVSLQPNISFNRLTESSKNRFNARLQSTRYSDDNIRDTNVQIFGADHETKRLRSIFNIKTTFRKDTTLASLNDIEADENNLETDSPSDTDLGLTKVSIDRKDFRISPQWGYSLSETYSLGLQYNYRVRDFSGLGSSGLVESDNSAYGINLANILDEKSFIAYGVQYSEFDPSDDASSKNISVDVSYKHKYSELSNILFVVGLRDTESPAGSSDGSVFKFSYADRTEVSNINILLSRNIATSGTGDVVERSELNIRYGLRLSELTRLSLRFLTFKNKSLENNLSDRLFVTTTPSFRHKLSRNYDVELSYRYRYEKLDNANESADSNAIFIGINYSLDNIHI